MKVYSVGGSVRDELLGLAVQDRDWVVVGADPEEMRRRGFRAVGADFPVFLHPESHEEYALARTERKTAPGYKGFAFHAAPDVTLEDDLRRRDLTINAMARGEDGTLVDPHGGERDLRAGVLRHVSEAFAEDPVRILRVARFAARFGFTVAPETRALMQRMVASGEADALVAERVWQEVSRGLMEREPSRMIEVLRECGALARVMPELGDSSADSAPGKRLDRAAARGFPLPVRYAALALDLSPEAAEALAARLRAPSDCRDLAAAAIRQRERLRGGAFDAEASLALLESIDAFRRPERLERLLEVAECDLGLPPGTALPFGALAADLEAARGVDAAAAARKNPGDIPGAVRRARLAAIAARHGR